MQVDSEFLKKLTEANAFAAEGVGWRQTGRRIKFALKKDELDQKIDNLNKSTKMLSRLRISGDFMHDEDIPVSPSRTTAKLTTFLSKVQKYSSCLYSAISAGWAIGCHSSHRTNLYLADCSAPMLRKKPLVSFQIELGSMAASKARNAWHYVQVDVLNDDEAQFHGSG